MTAIESRIDGNTTINTTENCASSGASLAPAGSHKIDFELVGIGPDTTLRNASVWAIWVPLDGTGSVPST